MQLKKTQDKKELQYATSKLLLINHCIWSEMHLFHSRKAVLYSKLGDFIRLNIQHEEELREVRCLIDI